MNKPRISLLIPNLDFGGAQRVFHDHSLLFSEHFDVTEFVFNLEGGNAFPTGNPLVTLDIPAGRRFLGKLLNFTRRVRRFRRAKRAFRAELSISHLEGADYVNVLSKEHEKTILCVHGSKLHDANIRGLLGLIRKRLLIRLLYNRADKIVAVSNDLASELIDLGVSPGRITVINNFFDPAAIRRKAGEALSPAERSIFDGTPVIVTSGRLAPGKNQKPLLDVFRRLLNTHPVKLVLVGDGEQRQSIRRHAEALGLAVFDASGEQELNGDYQVYFLGFLDNPFKVQAAASIFVLPSAWEGFPMVLGEAMACGLPIVSTDCATGPREMLAPRSGGRPKQPLTSAEWGEFGVLAPMLDDPPDENALAAWTAVLVRLLSDEAERARLSRAALRRSEDFTKEKLGLNWVELAQSLLDAP